MGDEGYQAMGDDCYFVLSYVQRVYYAKSG